MHPLLILHRGDSIPIKPNISLSLESVKLTVTLTFELLSQRIYLIEIIAIVSESKCNGIRGKASE